MSAREKVRRVRQGSLVSVRLAGSAWSGDVLCFVVVFLEAY